MRDVIELGAVASASAWVSASGTWFLGLVGVGFTWRQWWATGFQPTCTAEVEPSRDAIRVLIRNRGRAAGVINRVVVMTAESLGVEWAEGGDFDLPPTRLPGLDHMELIIQAPEGEKFELSYCVLVDWGRGQGRFP